MAGEEWNHQCMHAGCSLETTGIDELSIVEDEAWSVGHLAKTSCQQAVCMA